MFIRGNFRILSGLIGACLFIALPAICRAQLVVDNLNNAGAGSLRQAIIDANLGLGDEIKFAVTGTITLEATLPTVTTSMSIFGPPTGGITISGNNAVRLLVVSDTASLILDNLTLSNGANVGSFGSRAGRAGAILNDGALEIHRCTLAGNLAKGGQPGGSGVGGAIFNNGSLLITGSTLTGNQALGVLTSGQPLPIPGTGRGGAIYNSGNLVVVNSTFQGNVARSGFLQGVANGGAILNGGTAFITNATFSGNEAAGIPTDGGSAIGNEGSGKVSVQGAIFTAGKIDNCNGTLTDEGYNLADDNTCSFTQSTSKVTTAAAIALDPSGLQPNGGVTQTIALESNSAAIDQIPIGSCTELPGNEPLTVDQRGYGRPDPEDGPNGNCDIGAYEFQAVPAIDCTEAEASRPALVGFSPFIFQPEQVTGVMNASGNPFSIRISGVTQSKPVPRPFCPDAKVNGQTTFARTNSQGRGGLEYQIGFTATDTKTGDFCDGTVSVCVQDFLHRNQACADTGESFDAINCRGGLPRAK